MTALALAALAYSVAGATKATSIGETRIKEAISKGDLVAHYNGNRPVILAADLASWIESLPTERAS
ncbi:MAG: hypothetical protein FWD95_01970 [Nocardioidaceae bacterium]|nr:hypothetical protein [Nocardioidaceae bacterium]